MSIYLAHSFTPAISRINLHNNSQHMVAAVLHWDNRAHQYDIWYDHIRALTPHIIQAELLNVQQGHETYSIWQLFSICPIPLIETLDFLPTPMITQKKCWSKQTFISTEGLTGNLSQWGCTYKWKVFFSLICHYWWLTTKMRCPQHESVFGEPTW